VAGQEGVNLVRRQNERILAGAEAGLTEKELGEDALDPKPRLGVGS
jgi:hypothetical protein